MRKQLIQTPYGPLVAVWSATGLYACEFARGSAPTRASDPPSGTDDQALETAFADYFRHGELLWDLTILDWSGVTKFHRVVLEKCHQIPSGQTRSYGELARQAGRPKAARAVGGAMARNRWPILIPCHRVVGSKGTMTGYSGTGGIATKCSLLQLERQFPSPIPA